MLFRNTIASTDFKTRYQNSGVMEYTRQDSGNDFRFSVNIFVSNVRN